MFFPSALLVYETCYLLWFLIYSAEVLVMTKMDSPGTLHEWNQEPWPYCCHGNIHKSRGSFSCLWKQFDGFISFIFRVIWTTFLSATSVKMNFSESHVDVYRYSYPCLVSTVAVNGVVRCSLCKNVYSRAPLLFTISNLAVWAVLSDSDQINSEAITLNLLSCM